MSDFIELPHDRTSTRGRNRIIFLVVSALAILLGLRIGLSYWVNLLWFQSLGYGQVFWKSAGLQISVFVFFALSTFLILYGAFSAIRRMRARMDIG